MLKVDLAVVSVISEMTEKRTLTEATEISVLTERTEGSVEANLRDPATTRSNQWLRPEHRRVTFPTVLSNQAVVGMVQESGFLASNKSGQSAAFVTAPNGTGNSPPIEHPPRNRNPKSERVRKPKLLAYWS